MDVDEYSSSDVDADEILKRRILVMPMGNRKFDWKRRFW